jgi:hypothetical protein
VRHVLLGDQDAVCRDTRVTHCPFEGHPCLTGVTPEDVQRAVDRLLGLRHPVTAGSPMPSYQEGP